MIQPVRPKHLLWLPMAVGVLVASYAARADVIVTPTVTPLGGLFHYEYSITNDLPTPGVDVVLVDINVLPLDASLVNFIAPMGFQTLYDSGLGIVSFLPALESVDLFEVGATHSGFGFDSAHAPGASTFDALTLLGETVSGPTQAPVGDPTVIPEPTSVALLLVGLGTLAATRVRKRER